MKKMKLCYRRRDERTKSLFMHKSVDGSGSICISQARHAWQAAAAASTSIFGHQILPHRVPPPRSMEIAVTRRIPSPTQNPIQQQPTPTATKPSIPPRQGSTGIICLHCGCNLQAGVISQGMGGAASRLAAPIKQRRVEKGLDNRVAEALRERAKARTRTFRSVNSITMRLPRFKDGLKDIRDVFDHYDADSNGTIDNEELRSCLSKLEVRMSEKEADDVHRYCDVDSRKGIQFHEFVVLICLMYLLFGPNVTRRVSEFESAKLNYIFDELIDAFLFFNRDGDGKVTRKDVTQRMNEECDRERTPTHITTQLFKEMDLNKNGKVNLKEFLFSMIRWAGLEPEEEEDESNGASP